MCAAGAFLLVAGASAAGAQELPTGTWTGTVTDPGGDVITIEYEIEMVDGALQGHLIPPMEAGMPPIPMEEFRVEGDVIYFNWSPGTFLECEIEKEDDGSWMGPCIDPDGEMGFLTMEPPKG